MKFKIHYNVGDFEDCYIISGETIQDIQQKNDTEMKKRGIHFEKNNCWSEEL
uniref:Uncharacterized protein n=1 Tax=viral metagenome TaxID=1070528 RepID=A0A6H1ZW14_9ZZZZ